MNEMDSKGRMPGDNGYDVSKTMLPILMTLIESETYESLPTKEDKLDRIKLVYSKFKTAGKKMLLADDPDLDVKVMAVQ